MSNTLERPYLLSIAGFDPSAGAGVLADIKTFETNKVYGLGVCTAITYQTGSSFEGLDWVPEDKIIRQLDILFKEYTVNWVKIGLIQNFDILNRIVDRIRELNPGARIVWDPIIKASAGYVFHESMESGNLFELAGKMLLITPNLEEIRFFFPDHSPEEGAKWLSEKTAVLLKGGHNEGKEANDLLFQKGKNTARLISEKSDYKKHGSGCILSSAILTNLAKDYELAEACREGKEYITDYINSHSGILGYHYV